jgi:HD superfamily phosphohydrolase
MSNSWPKVIRDPIHNLITFDDNNTDRLLLALINTKEFQRLRRIKQLGLSELVFPGSNHSRFSHSIGVMHIAKLIIDSIEKSYPKQITGEQRTAVLAAALLHDIGHGPFSHAFEKITNDNHENRTIEIINDSSTEVNSILTKYQIDLPKKLKLFFDKEIDEQTKKDAGIPQLLVDIVSSQLDADRADYLLRDSHTTGTEYGKFDLKWLLLQQKIDIKKDRLCVGKKAAIAAEAYVFARFHMYQTVYYHKTTRAAEVMLKLIFKRFKTLLSNENGLIAKQQLVPGAPDIVVKAFSNEKITLNNYLSLDNYTISEFFKACANSPDRILNKLSNGIINRNLYKAIDLSGYSMDLIANFISDVRTKIKVDPADEEYYFVHDSPADTPYKPYDPDDEHPTSEIYIETDTGKSVEISRSREILKELKKRYTLLRYYFPIEHR